MRTSILCANALISLIALSHDVLASDTSRAEDKMYMQPVRAFPENEADIVADQTRLKLIG